MNVRRPSIVLAVTSAQSLRLMDGFPAYLTTRGWDVHVVCSDPPATPTPGWVAHSIPMRRDPSPLRDLLALVRWVRLLSIIRPDIVVAGTPKAGLLGTLAAYVTLRPRRVYMLRGLRLSTVRGGQRVVLYILEKLVMAAATQVHAISASLAREVIELGLVRPAKITVLGAGSSNGVVIPAAEELQASKDEHREILGLPKVPTIGYVGRLNPDKGVDVLLEAMGILQDPAEKQLLIIGGEESPGYLRTLLASSSVNPEDVRWVGSIPDPGKYYPAMDVLCLPTKREGFGNVIIEAASYGVPSIASEVTGCVDAVLDGVTGHLVPPNDAKALATALGAALINREGSRQMGIAGRRRVIENFTREHVWKLTEAYYRELLRRQ